MEIHTYLGFENYDNLGTLLLKPRVIESHRIILMPMATVQSDLSLISRRSVSAP